MTEHEWTDAFFLGYVTIHAQSERALFSAADVKRLHELAGVEVPEVDGFVAMHEEYTKPLVKTAYERLHKS